MRDIVKCLIVVALVIILLNGETIAQDETGVSQGGDDQSSLSGKLASVRGGCVYNGCRCYPGTPQGQYCYGNNVYECNPRGGCCSYGYRKSCAQCGRLSC